MINVVHIQTHLPSAGNAAFRLHRELIERGVKSNMLSLSSDVSESSTIQHLRKRAEVVSILNQKIESRLTRNSIEKFGLFSYPLLGNNITKHEFVENADILYIHWAIGGFLNFNNFHQLAKLNKPIIIFMHDMWNITGGCHYSFTCENFLKDCSNCQVFFENKQKKLAIKEFNKKKKFYDAYDNLHFIAPSKWLYELAKKSMLLKNKPVHYIPNIIGKEPFKPLDKKVTRKLLNLNEDDTIIAFGAASPNSPYKGWKYLKEALDILSIKLKDKPITVIIFGSEHNAEIADAIPFKTIFFGRLNDNYSTALIYNSANVFVAPSVAETFGLVILEALRCGTPVAAFNTGGIPDIIEHKQNGYLAEYRNANDLAEGISFCLQKNLEGFAPKKFDSQPIITSHLNIFDQLLKAK
ncbi:glycosyltransferase [Kriegella sp. EG-1]|nr:glycosyltransferase [Flavobacteriaceae bacterium EG-1]